MINLIITAATFFAQALTGAWYTLSDNLSERKKKILFKIICPLFYLCDCVLCISFKNSFASIFSLLLLSGFVIHFAGELADKLKKKKSFYIQPSFFTAGKLCFFSAFCVFSKPLLPVKFLIYELSVFLVFCVIFIILLTKKKQLLTSFFYPVMLFGITDILFFVKTVFCGIFCFGSQIKGFDSLSFILISGSLFILISDIIYVMMIFFGKYSNHLSQLRIYLYYYGMMLLACTTLFTGGIV